jgi:hypothetical protein
LTWPEFAHIRWKTVPEFSAMGVDEIALKKGHPNYVVIVTARCTQGDLHLLAAGSVPVSTAQISGARAAGA